jgi:hypothetical protein
MTPMTDANIHAIIDAASRALPPRSDDDALKNG